MEQNWFLFYNWLYNYKSLGQILPLKLEQLFNQLFDSIDYLIVKITLKSNRN